MTDSEALEQRVRQLEKARAEDAVKLQMLVSQNERILRKQDELLAESHERKGREAAALIAVEQKTEDKQERNAMIRHFLPVGLFVGVWQMVLWLVEWIGNGGTSGQ